MSTLILKFFKNISVNFTFINFYVTIWLKLGGKMQFDRKYEKQMISIDVSIFLNFPILKFLSFVLNKIHNIYITKCIVFQHISKLSLLNFIYLFVNFYKNEQEKTCPNKILFKYIFTKIFFLFCNTF